MSTPPTQPAASQPATDAAERFGPAKEPDTIIRVIQHVNNLNGNLTGVAVGSVRGDLIEVKFYGIGAGQDRPGVFHSLLVEQKKQEPYKFLKPFNALDRNIFFGRDRETSQVLRSLLHNEVVIVYGRAGIGKTSLLTAGVIPPLMEAGALVLQLQNYTRPAAAVREALNASGEHLNVGQTGSDGERLPELVRRIVEAAGGTLFLVLDQFELLFEPAVGDEQRVAFIEDLARLAKPAVLLGDVAQRLTAQRRESAEPGEEPPPVNASHLLRLVIVVRDEASSKLAELQNLVPDLLKCHSTLLPLNHEAAKEAIEQPLRLLKPGVRYEHGMLDRYLIPDLDELTPDEPGIYPPHLQIVCYTLYEEAISDFDLNIIGPKAYRGGGGPGQENRKGAEGILVRYMTNMLRTRLSNIKDDALQVLTQMASPGAGPWVAPSQLRLEGPSTGEADRRVERVLEQLVGVQLLVRRREGDGPRYAFTSPIVAQEARRLSGPDAERRFRAEEELDGMWAAWLERDALATREQLRYLAEFGTHLRPRAIRLLFLLRSAAEWDEPAGPWLDLLRDGDGRVLVAQLEGADMGDDAQPHSLTILDYAEALLDFPRSERKPPAAYSQFGPLAGNAVTNASAPARQASALALTVLEHSEALDRMDAALRTLGVVTRKRRQVELRGAMADADPEFANLNSSLRPWDKLLIWRWRAQRKVKREWPRVWGLTVGGAAGAALAVGLLRALTAVPPEEYGGVQFMVYFFMAWPVGAALAFGMALANPLLSAAPGEAGFWSRLREPLLAAALGTFGFGLVHAAMMTMGDLELAQPSTYYQAVAGFIAGLGLSTALAVRPRAGRLSGALRWSLRLLIVSVTMVFINWFLLKVWLKEDVQTVLTRGPGILQSHIKLHYESLRNVEAEPLWWVSLFNESSGNYDYNTLAALDSALAGIAMLVGVALGRRWAERPPALRWKRPARHDSR